MFGKLGTRTLLLIVAALAIIWLLADRFSTGAQQRTFRSEVIALDTSAVTRMTVRARTAGHEEAVLERKGPGWTLSFKGGTYGADEENVRMLLGQFARMKADHVVGTIDAVRDRYDLSDSLASTIELTTADGQVHSVIVGRTTAGEQGDNWTAVKIASEKEVYATPGSLSVDNPPLMAWRPRSLIKGDPANWQRLTFDYPADSGYVLERHGNGWLVDDMPTDGEKLGKFLMSLSVCKGQQFADTVAVDSLPVQYRLLIEDTSRAAPIDVRIYSLGYGFVATSTINPGTVLWFDALREVPRLFRPRHAWFPRPPEPQAAIP